MSNFSQNPNAFRKSNKNSKSKKEGIIKKNYFEKNKRESKQKKFNEEYENFSNAETKRNNDSRNSSASKRFSNSNRNENNVSRESSTKKNLINEKRDSFVNISEQIEKKKNKILNLNINTEFENDSSDRHNKSDKKEFCVNGNISFGVSLNNNCAPETFDPEFNIYSQAKNQKYY